VAAWQDLRALRDAERFDAWLMRLLVRSCYREARRYRRLARSELSIGQPDHAGEGSADRDLALRDELDRAFRRLTPDQRAVLVVHHYLGLRDAEAASVLDIPAGTFKSRLHYATVALRAALEAEDRRAAMTSESMA
jgi:RNA polymerase sigma-70 factor (ECF subfamily)